MAEKKKKKKKKLADNSHEGGVSKNSSGDVSVAIHGSSIADPQLPT